MKSSEREKGANRERAVRKKRWGGGRRESSRHARSRSGYASEWWYNSFCLLFQFSSRFFFLRGGRFERTRRGRPNSLFPIPGGARGLICLDWSRSVLAWARRISLERPLLEFQIDLSPRKRRDHSRASSALLALALRSLKSTLGKKQSACKQLTNQQEWKLTASRDLGRPMLKQTFSAPSSTANSCRPRLCRPALFL